MELISLRKKQSLSAVCGCFRGMPTVLRIGRFRFHFFSDEGHEPHTSTCELLMASCKFWLEPAIMLANNKGVPAHELRRIEELVFENQEILKNAYDDRHPR